VIDIVEKIREKKIFSGLFAKAALDSEWENEKVGEHQRWGIKSSRDRRYIYIIWIRYSSDLTLFAKVCCFLLVLSLWASTSVVDMMHDDKQCQRQHQSRSDTTNLLNRHLHKGKLLRSVQLQHKKKHLNIKNQLTVEVMYDTMTRQVIAQ